ncbi:MAG TPA: hypothetical protein VHE12_06710 [bacterium]|nr:hypothetical protein [bacterium]
MGPTERPSLDPKRPWILTLLCVLAFLGCFLKIYYVFSSEIRAVARWYPVYVSMSTLLLMASLFGLMQMRRWGFHLFILFFLVHQVVQIAVGKWDIASSLLFSALLLVGSLRYKTLV